MLERRGVRACDRGHRRRRAAVAGVGRAKGRRSLLRRRLRDHLADAGRRRRALPLDDQRAVPQRRRARADHHGSGRADGRRGRDATAGIGGGLLAAAVAFAPSFAFILLGGERFDRLRRDRRARAFLDGAGPAAIGAILGSAVPLARALTEPWQHAILIRRRRVSDAHSNVL